MTTSPMQQVSTSTIMCGPDHWDSKMYGLLSRHNIGNLQESLASYSAMHTWPKNISSQTPECLSMLTSNWSWRISWSNTHRSICQEQHQPHHPQYHSTAAWMKASYLQPSTPFWSMKEVANSVALYVKTTSEKQKSTKQPITVKSVDSQFANLHPVATAGSCTWRRKSSKNTGSKMITVTGTWNNEPCSHKITYKFIFRTSSTIYWNVEVYWL